MSSANIKTTQKCSEGNTKPQSVEKLQRNFCFTLNNYNDIEIKVLKDLTCKYIVFGKEVGESGTPHLQGYVEFKNACSFSALKKRIGKRAHIERRFGTSKDAAGYCCKGTQDKPGDLSYSFFFENYGANADVYEWGEISSQGARADLKQIQEDIMEGKTVDQITMEDPIKFHQYGRTLNKIEDIRMRSIFRTEMTQGIWYWGKTGVGKSHKAFEGFHPSTHYVYPYDNGWWDGYCQQPIVVLNEFRGRMHMTFSKLLNLVDKWPCLVKRRCREPMPFVSKTVIITSSECPKKCYSNINPETGLEDFDEDFEQLLRRFKIVEVK